MQQDRRRPTEKPAQNLPAPRRTTLIAFLVTLIAVSILTLGMVLPYLLAVTMGAILALLVQPVFRRLKRHGFKPKTASALVTLGVVLVIMGPISFFLNKVVQQATTIGQSLTESGFSLRSVLDRVSGWGPISMIIGDPQAFEAQVRKWLQSAGGGATSAILGVAANVPNILLQMALTALACYFFLLDGGTFMYWASDKIPMDSDVRAKVVKSFKDTAVSVIWATLAAASVQSAIMLIAYLVLDVPAAFLAAGATFIFAWIPIVGSTPVWVIGTIYLYTQGSIAKAVLMLAFGIFTSVIDNFVRPMVLKGRSKMHPLVSLVAIFGGISTFGIMGVFVGPIIAAVMISLLQIWPEVGSRFGILPDQKKKPMTHKDDSFAKTA